MNYTMTEEELSAWARKIAIAAADKGRKEAERWAIEQSHRSPMAASFSNLVVTPVYGTNVAELTHNGKPLKVPAGSTIDVGSFSSNQASQWSTGGFKWSIVGSKPSMTLGGLIVRKGRHFRLNQHQWDVYKHMWKLYHKNPAIMYRIVRDYMRQRQQTKDSGIFC